MKRDFPDHIVINRGFGGSEIEDSIYFADRIIHPYKPKHILLYAGDNDIARGKSAETVFSDFNKFVFTVHKKLPKAKISFIAIKPSLSRWKLAKKMVKANGIIKDFCNTDNRLQFIDIWTPMLGNDGKPKPELIDAIRIIKNAGGRIQKKQMAEEAEKSKIIIVNARKQNFTQARFASLDKNIVQPLVDTWGFVEVEKVGRNRWLKLTDDGNYASEFLL